MAQPLSFQDVIMRLQTFWAEHGCIIWQPYYTQVGAGTGNPATFLRVLGPEPWNVAYVEPSIRPDDGRYGDNPNRMQMHTQFQVILKPDPGDPQGLYLQSLEAIGIDRRQHDIRFVEDNWESPALGAWGLGWEVWLDGQEITQFTYFQQAGGQDLPVPAVEITYGLERIVLALQGVESVWDINWGNNFKYRDALLQSEIEHCRYYFEVANVDALRQIFDTYEAESKSALAQTPPLVMPAYDYLLKCSHLFNVLDTRGAVGVVERAKFFKRMQSLGSKIAEAYVEQRRTMEYPMLPQGWEIDGETGALSVPTPKAPEIITGAYPTKPAPFLLEIGVEELPVSDLIRAISEVERRLPELISNARLEAKSISVAGTPRRIVAYIEGLSPNQRADTVIVRGPPIRAAYDVNGKPTPAAEGFARKNGVAVEKLEKLEFEGGEYVSATIIAEAHPTHAVFGAQLWNLVSHVKTNFEKSMAWMPGSDFVRTQQNSVSTALGFARPIRWIVALLGDGVVPLTFAGKIASYSDVFAGRTTRGTRLAGSPEIEVKNAADYFKKLAKQGVILDPVERRDAIAGQVSALAKQAGGRLKEDADLLDEVTNLVEQPMALLGHFEEAFLDLPAPVLTTVMKKHQRYFAVEDKKGNLLNVFIAVRNGDDKNLDSVTHGNEHVIRARFSDARFFYAQDTQHKLSEFVPKLKTLTFQEQLGSYYDKSVRLEGLTGRIAGLLGLTDTDLDIAIRAARLAKADLATHMVVEMTSLQGIMGREYALRSGEPDAVAQAIAEHYLPRAAGDSLPESGPGIATALADRVDTLVGLLAVGMAPTGSADPFGLRRAALGIVQILLGHQVSLDLRQLIGLSAETQPVTVDQDAQAATLDFIAGRLRGVLRETYRHDVAEAALGALAHDPYRASIHAGQLAQIVERADWPLILDAYARCVRITRDQKKAFELKPNAFKETVEKNLYAAYQQAAKSIGNDPDVDQFMAGFSPMVRAISAFFAPAAEGGVMVMDKDQAVRENRLALLQHITGLGVPVADFSQLEGF